MAYSVSFHTPMRFLQLTEEALTEARLAILSCVYSKARDEEVALHLTVLQMLESANYSEF